jgi:YesN/AraC family two-component response regulator
MSQQKVSNIADRLIQMLKQYFSISVTIGISSEFEGLTETGKAFLECIEVVESGMIDGLDQYAFYSDYLGKQMQHNNRLITKAKNFINEHIKEDIKLNELAEVLGLSQGYISTLFKKVTGQNFVDYVTMLKINYAKSLLKESNLKIYEVSDMLGYENAYYFSRVFKKITGITPSEYLAK